MTDRIRNISPALLLIILLTLGGCGSSTRDSRLTDIESILSDHPKEALKRLGAICPDSLSKQDRHYLEFLTIKAEDKAYIRHTSDSLILRLAEYYKSRPSSGLYPEVLYYAGRVYSDLGDSHTALRYYQDAFDLLPKDTKDTDLKIRIMSNNARLLNILRLPNEAIPYLTSILEIERERKDTLGMIYNLQLLGHTYMRAGDFNKAQDLLHEAIGLENLFHKYDGVVTKTYLARAKYQTGDTDAALRIIRGVPEIADSLDRNNALCYASKIYLKAGILDSAYMYADRLIHAQDYHHKEVGYEVILNSGLRPLLHPDSVDAYLSSYVSLLNSYHDSHAAQLAINQQALYNYQLHERERIKAEKRVYAVFCWLIVVLAVLLVASSVFFYYTYRKQKTMIELQQTLNEVRANYNKMKEARNSTPGEPVTEQPVTELSVVEESTFEEPTTEQPAKSSVKENKVMLIEPEDTADASATLFEAISSNRPSQKTVRKEIIEILLASAKECEGLLCIHPVILQSDTYLKLQDYIHQAKYIKVNDPFWKELEKMVASVYPYFRKKLTLLSSGKMMADDFHYTLLVKCGIRPKYILILLNQSNGSFTSKRSTLSKMFFDTSLPARYFNNIIRNL